MVTAWDWLRAGTSLVHLPRHARPRAHALGELGLSLIVLGALIWAFADLVGRLAP